MFLNSTRRAIIPHKDLNKVKIMNSKVEDYGVLPVERPKIKATKKLDLSGDAGRQIIKSETKLALRTHAKTFKKLADM